MKKITLLITALLLSTSAFAANPSAPKEKAPGVRDVYEQAKAAIRERAINGEAARDVIRKSVEALVKVTGEKLKGLDIEQMEKALMVASEEAGAALMKNANETTLDIDSVNTLLKRSNTEQDIQATNAALGLPQTKASIKAFLAEFVTAVHRGESPKVAFERLMKEKYGTDEAKRLTFEEMMKRCKALLGLA